MINVAQLESDAAEGARRQGSLETKTDCGTPKVRLLAVGDTVTCTASRGSWSRDWLVKVANAYGGILLPNGFPSSASSASDVPDPALVRIDPLLKRAVRVVDGADIEAVMRVTPSQVTGPISYHCPTKMNLSDGHHDWCAMQAMGATMRLRVDVHDGSWRWVAEQVILVMDDLERSAEENGAELARSRGVGGGASLTSAAARHASWSPTTPRSIPATRHYRAASTSP